MPQWETVARLVDLPDGESLLVQYDGRGVAIFREGDTLYAIDDRCPHAGASLGGGHFEAGVVTCPLHAWAFRLADGTCVGSRRIKTRAYPLRVEAGEIQLAQPA